MNSSLRDQLLAAGLVTEKQVRQATQQEQQRQFRKHHSNPPRGPSQPQTPSPKAQADAAQTAKTARDKELNRRKEDKAQRRARIAEIEQIIDQNRVPRLDTDDHYSFIDGKKIRRMSVDPARREALTKGELAIVRYKGHYAVVPAPIAERIRERDPNMVVPVVPPKAAASSEPDDAYKDFVVPDDLMW
jgi:uncharacterized protein YaiL (DUF2058 family)